MPRRNWPVSYVSQLTGDRPISVRRFEHVHPGLDYVVLDLGVGSIEVQCHDGVSAIYWTRFCPVDIPLLEHALAQLKDAKGWD